MKTSKFFVVSLAVFFFTAFGLVARPCGGPGMGMGPGMGPGWGQGSGGFDGGPGFWMDVDDRIDRLDYRLNLTTAQKELAKAIFTEYQNRMVVISEKLPDLNQELQDLLQKDTVDLKAVRAKMEEINRLQVDLRMLHVEQHVAFEKILTGEQKEKLNTRGKAWPGFWGRGPGAGGPRGGGMK